MTPYDLSAIVSNRDPLSIREENSQQYQPMKYQDIGVSYISKSSLNKPANMNFNITPT